MEKNYLVIYISNEDNEIWNDIIWGKDIGEIIEIYWKQDVRIINIIEIGDKIEK